MAKLMEIINKEDNFKTNVSKLELLETGFSSLGKTLGNDPSMTNWTSVQNGDIFSKQFLQSLNTRQEQLAAHFASKFKNFNDWVTTIPSETGVTPIQFALNVPRWSDKYIAEETIASYHEILTDIVSVEKTIRETAFYDSKNKFLQTLWRIQEWSKSRKYSSNSNAVVCWDFRRHWGYGQGQVTSEGSFASVIGTSYGVSASSTDSKSVNHFGVRVYNVHSIPVGATVVIEAGSFANGRITSGGSAGETWRKSGTVRFNITNTPLSGGDGYLTFSGFYNSDDVTGNNAPYVESIRGAQSPSFNSSDPTLTWFKSLTFL